MVKIFSTDSSLVLDSVWEHEEVFVQQHNKHCMVVFFSSQSSKCKDPVHGSSSDNMAVNLRNIASCLFSNTKEIFWKFVEEVTVKADNLLLSSFALCSP